MPDSKIIKLELIAFGLIISLLRLIYIGQIPLSPDEAYYWSWSLKPAVSYFDQPGMVAWVHWLFNHLPYAPSVFTVRLPAVLLMLLSTILVWLCYKELFENDQASLWFALGFNLIPIYFFSGLIMLHDTVLIFFLSGFYYFCFRWLKKPTQLNWLGACLFLLGALYSKLNAILVAMSLALYLVISPFGREQLKKPYCWIIGLVSAFGYSPVIIWNHQLSWPHLLAVQQLTRAKNIYFLKRLEHFIEYFSSQFGAYSPLIFIGIIASIFYGIKLIKKGEEREKILLLLSLFLPSFLYFLIQSFRSPVFGNWSLVAYFPGILLYSWLCFQSSAKKGVFSVRFWKIGICLSLILCLPIVIEARYRLLRPSAWQLKEKYHLAQNPDERLDIELEGWNELAEFIQRHQQPDDLFSARTYQMASILSFYLPSHPIPVVALSAGHKHSQFNLWTDPSQLKNRWTIYVDTHPMPKPVQNGFSKLEELAVPLEIYRAGFKVKEFYIYRGFDYKTSFPP